MQKDELLRTLIMGLMGFFVINAIMPDLLTILVPASMVGFVVYYAYKARGKEVDTEPDWAR